MNIHRLLKEFYQYEQELDSKDEIKTHDLKCFIIKLIGTIEDEELKIMASRIFNNHFLKSKPNE